MNWHSLLSCTRSAKTLWVPISHPQGRQRSCVRPSFSVLGVLEISITTTLRESAKCIWGCRISVSYGSMIMSAHHTHLQVWPAEGLLPNIIEYFRDMYVLATGNTVVRRCGMFPRFRARALPIPGNGVDICWPGPGGGMGMLRRV